MKIGFVFDDSLDKPDGVQQYILALGDWLRQMGHEVHYLVGETLRQDIPHVYSLSRNIHVRFNGNRLSVPLPASRRVIRKLLAREQYDILHVQLPYSPFLAQRVIKAASSNTAVIGTFHVAPISYLMTLGTKLLGMVLRRSLKRFDEVFSVSTPAQSFAKHTFGISSDVLPNVIDYDRFYNSKPFEASTDMLTILFLGRLVPRKGCQLLLEAIKQLVQETVPSFRVLICGGGPLELSLKQYVTDNKLEAYIEFAGYVSEDDKPRYYASSDISVFPSKGGESFGIVLLEAMASGQATVLAGNNSGYSAVMASQPELLFSTQDVTELTAKLKHFLENAQDRQRMAEWGMRYAQQFDTRNVGSQLVERYKQALRLRRNMR